MTLRIFKGNRSPSLTDTIRIDGVPFDLTGSTVKFRMRQVGSSTLKVDTAASVVLAATGQVEYLWAALDVDTAAVYLGWWQVTLPGGNLQNTPEFVVEIDDNAQSDLHIRDFVESGLPETALQQLVYQETLEVERRYGTDAQMTVTTRGNDSRTIRLQRPVLSVTSIAEYTLDRELISTLTATDYALLDGGRGLERLSGSSWGRLTWAPVVVVVYLPVPEVESRKRVVTDLVRLAVQHNALASEKIGDYQSTSVEYARERERILGMLPRQRGLRYA